MNVLLSGMLASDGSAGGTERNELTLSAMSIFQVRIDDDGSPAPATGPG